MSATPAALGQGAIELAQSAAEEGADPGSINVGSTIAVLLGLVVALIALHAGRPVRHHKSPGAGPGASLPPAPGDPQGSVRPETDEVAEPDASTQAQGSAFDEMPGVGHLPPPERRPPVVDPADLASAALPVRVVGYDRDTVRARLAALAAAYRDLEQLVPPETLAQVRAHRAGANLGDAYGGGAPGAEYEDVVPEAETLAADAEHDHADVTPRPETDAGGPQAAADDDDATP